MPRASGSIYRESPEDWAANQHCPGSKTERLQDISAPANTAIHIDFTLSVNGLDHLRQCLDACRHAVLLATTVVGDDDAVRAVFQRQQRILGSQDPFHQHRQSG